MRSDITEFIVGLLVILVIVALILIVFSNFIFPLLGWLFENVKGILLIVGIILILIFIIRRVF